MKSTYPFLISIILFIATGCSLDNDPDKVLESIKDFIRSGDIKRAIHLADSIKNHNGDNETIFLKADSLSEIAKRINIDFSVTESEIISEIENKTGSISKDEMENWEKNKWIESRLIEGKKMYFRRAASNLVLMRKFHEKRDKISEENANDPELIFRLKHTEQIIKASQYQSGPVIPVDMKIIYSITVHPDVVPEGETIRCWMPWPKVNHPRQVNIELLSSSDQEYLISPDTAVHSTIYFEGTAERGKPLDFTVAFRYRSMGEYFYLKDINSQPYNKMSTEFKIYTSEQLPHISFSKEIRNLADSLTTPDDNPMEIVKKIYGWFKNNIIWTGALEYSIMPDIPGYVYHNKRGDCGMQTFMFISMLRYKGIPVKWQSGWMVPPDAENLHDWCEVYYEGTGWVPVDISYDLQQTGNVNLREFYMSGIDSYRLIINDGIAGTLYPKKQYLRSEPYDFQRGEVEWKGGNLYFDKWDYHMEIEYENQSHK